MDKNVELKEFVVKIVIDDPNGSVEDELNQQLDGLYDLGHKVVDVAITQLNQ